MRRIAKAAALAAVTAWVYAPCLRGTWLWDDGLEVSRNPLLSSPDGWRQAWIDPGGMDYFPLKSFLQWMEWHAWGAEPLGYHLVNLGLHIASALLLWRLLALLGVRAAYLGALLFAVHPLSVESVAWISEFKNTASMPLLLLSAIAYVRFDLDRRRTRWAWALGLFAASLACKTSAVMFPFMLLVFAWWRRGRIRRDDLWEVAPFFGVSLAMGLATLWFQSTRAIGAAGVAGSLGGRVLEAGCSTVLYFFSMAWPFRVAPIYAPVGSAVAAAAAWLLVLLTVGYLWRHWQGYGRHALLGFSWFLLNLAPVLGILPMSYLRIAPRADHLAYLSLVGFVGLAAAGLGALLRVLRRRAPLGLGPRLALTAALAAAVAVLAVASRGYAAAFTGDEALWSLAVRANPDSWLARNNLGKVLLERRLPGRARQEFEEAVRLRPDSAEARANLGNALEALGRHDEARLAYRAALAIEPSFAGGHYDLGLSLLRSGAPAAAADEFRAAIAADPGHAGAHNSLGLALAAAGQPAAAMEQYRMAVRCDPRLPEAHLNLGNSLFRRGDTEGAAAEYREALRLDPVYVGAHLNLSVALDSLGRHDEAQAERMQARTLSGRPDGAAGGTP